MSLLAKSRKEGQIQHITPQSAGWRYIGFDVWMLKKGQTVTLESGEVLRGMDCVILAAGGAAGSKVGGVLDGYRLAKGLGHHRTALTPALVQLKTDTRLRRYSG